MRPKATLPARRAAVSSASSSGRHVLQLAAGQEPGGQQRVVQLVGVARIRTLLLAHPRDGVRVERAEIAGRRRIGGPPRLHRMAPPLLERGIVEEGVRLGVEDLVREERRLRRVARDEPQLAAVDPAEHGAKPFEVHRLLEAVAHGLRDQRMIGDLPIAGDVLQAGGRVGKHRRHQVVGQHPLDLRRHLARRLARAAPPARWSCSSATAS